MVGLPKSDGDLMIRPSVIDLFAGVGGLSDGFISAGCDILAAVEKDADLAACYSLAHRRRGQNPVVKTTDIRFVDPSKLMAELSLEPSQLDFLIGGPPCQGFSTIGKRDDNDERNSLLFQFPRFLSTFRSQGFLIENVPGLLVSDREPIMARLLEELRGLGYDDATYKIVDAASAGVPQRRLRVVIYGTLNGASTDLRPLEPAESVTPTVWDAIKDLPDPEWAATRYKPGTRIPYGRRSPSAYAQRLRGASKGVSHWEPVAHASATVLAYGRLEPGATDEATRCYRLLPDRPSRTLRAGSRTRTACRPVHPYQARVITVREAARLHSFRDTYPLPTTKSGAHVAIGNAVPPRLSQALASALLQALRS